MLAGPKDAQLLVVCWVLVLTMISPPAQKISGDSNFSDAIINGLVWLSPVRWGAEILFVAQTRKLSYAWKMPPSFYEKPERDSALALTLAYPFQEAFADKQHFFKVREVDREQGICQIKPQYQIVEVFNLPILFCFGLMARLLALALLRFTALRASVRESHFTRTPEITFDGHTGTSAARFRSGPALLVFAVAAAGDGTGTRPSRGGRPHRRS